MELSIYLYHPDKSYAGELQKYIAAVLFDADYRASVLLSSDKVKFADFIDKHASVIDILFLTADYTGFSMGKKFRKQSRSATLVFYDGNTTQMPNAFCMLPISYMVSECDKKSFSENILLAAMWTVKGKNRFYHESRTDILNINYDDIDYFESNYRVVNIHFTDGTIKTITAKLDDIQSRLPGEIFCRVHQSYLVNLTHISYIDKTAKTIHFLSGEYTYASKAYYPSLIESVKGSVGSETI